MPRKIILSSAALMAICLTQTPASVQAMGGGGGCVSANISMTLVSTPLNFASLSACGGTAGTLTLNPKTGNLTTGGCIVGTSGAIQIARIRVRANQSSAGDNVYIRVPASAIISSGGNNMNVNAFGLKKGGGATPTIVLNGNKTTTVDMGATLNVGGGQAGGTYTGAGSLSATCT